MVWRIDHPQGNEAAKIRWEIVPYTLGKVLDLGCGSVKAFPHFTGVDSCRDTELFGTSMAPDVVVDTCERLDMFDTKSCDAVFSSHLLEHIEDFRSALMEWWRLIKVGGYLVLYLPHRNLYPRIGEPGANPDHKHDFLPQDIVTAMGDADGGWDLIERQVRDRDLEYSFLLVFQKRDDGGRQYSFSRLKHTGPTACVVRYGGFGDMLQAANVLPGLKRQGFHVTVMTTPNGKDVLALDPNVDAWYIQDRDQVPNHLLPEFWDYVSKKFDRFVNLSESVEGTLLAMPGRCNFNWPYEMRHRRLNDNYLAFTAELAQVDYCCESRFYPSPQEEEEAADRLLDAGYNIMVVLSGSSAHKFYPWQDNVIARILVDRPDCRIFLTGDAACKLLEQGWENEPRVVRLSGALTIRKTLALAQKVDAVVGPETGVLNAVAFEPKVRKAILLSHSSHDNLTRDWRNTGVVEPQDVACYPCHRLHHTTTHCLVDDETGAAVCQLSIHPDRVFDALEAA